MKAFFNVVTTYITFYISRFQFILEMMKLSKGMVLTDGILIWGKPYIKNDIKDDINWRFVPVGEEHGCKSSTCNHYSHSPSDYDYRVIIRPGEQFSLVRSNNDRDEFYYFLRTNSGRNYLLRHTKTHVYHDDLQIEKSGFQLTP